MNNEAWSELRSRGSTGWTKASLSIDTPGDWYACPLKFPSTKARSVWMRGADGSRGRGRCNSMLFHSCWLGWPHGRRGTESEVWQLTHLPRFLEAVIGHDVVIPRARGGAEERRLCWEDGALVGQRIC